MIDFVARYHEAVARGEHDSECEWIDTPMYRRHLCHCARRRRIASGLIEPPQISYNAPSCGNCYGSLYSTGDGWECQECHVSWSYKAMDGEPGEFTDDYGNLSIAPQLPLEPDKEPK